MAHKFYCPLKNNSTFFNFLPSEFNSKFFHFFSPWRHIYAGEAFCHLLDITHYFESLCQDLFVNCPKLFNVSSHKCSF